MLLKINVWGGGGQGVDTGEWKKEWGWGGNSPTCVEMRPEVTREGGGEKGAGGDGCYRCKQTICTLEGGGQVRREAGGKTVKQRERRERERGRGRFTGTLVKGEAWLKESTPTETNKILF